jgi:hypothetical protein
MWMPDEGQMQSSFVGKYLTIKAVVPTSQQNNQYTFDRADINTTYTWFMPTTATVTGTFNGK